MTFLDALTYWEDLQAQAAIHGRELDALEGEDFSTWADETHGHYTRTLTTYNAAVARTVKAQTTTDAAYATLLTRFDAFVASQKQ